MAPRKKKGFDLQAQVIKHLRQISRIYPVKKEVLKEARKKKDHNGHWLLTCFSCDALFHERLVQVDHTEAVGSFVGKWDEYISRMFCGKENLRVLCLGCHKEKTLKDREEIKRKKLTP